MHLRTATVMANQWPARILRFRNVLTDHMPIRPTGIIGTGIIDIDTGDGFHVATSQLKSPLAR